MKIVELDGYAVNPGDLSLEALKAYGELVVYERTDANDVVSRAQDAEMLLINKINLTADGTVASTALYWCDGDGLQHSRH